MKMTSKAMMINKSKPLTSRLAFTLIELLIAIAIIASLAALVFAAVTAAKDNSQHIQTASAISNVSTSLLLHKSIENKLPAADASCYLHYDPLLDHNDPLNNVDSAYATWPVLNKLVAHRGLQLDHELLVKEGSAQRLHDAWGQGIRYVIGTGKDDNEHEPEGLFTNWNWDSVNDKAKQNAYPYVYSYGPDNDDGSNTELWVYEVERQ